jgi:hypothetical protein
VSRQASLQRYSERRKIIKAGRKKTEKRRTDFKKDEHDIFALTFLF